MTLLFWMMTALAAEVVALAPEGPLTVGQPGLVHVGVADDLGRPVTQAPAVWIDGQLQEAARLVRPGVWAWEVPPPLQSGELRLSVQPTRDDEVEELVLEVDEPLRPRFSLPDRIEAVAGDDEVRIAVRGEGIAPDALVVATSEGDIVAREVVEGGVDLVLQPEDVRIPRFAAVGVHLPGERTRWTTVRLRARQRFAYQLSPGDSGQMSIGSRNYGPVDADAQGEIVFNADIYPGDTVARLRFEDDLGNPSETVVPLTTQPDEVLALLVTSELVLGGQIPELHLRGLTPLGRLWQQEQPRCVSPGIGQLQLDVVDMGSWVARLPGDLSSRPVDVRVRCQLGRSGEASARVPVSTELPARLELTVRPTELSADLPIADIQVVLEDATGQPMPPDGVRVRASRGEVEMEPESGYRLRGEYRGEGAIESGEDVLTASYVLPPGAGDVVDLVVSHGALPPVGTEEEVQRVRTYARALDASGRPLPDVPVRLRTGEEVVDAVTGTDGWARGTLPFSGRGPVPLLAKAGSVRKGTIVFPGDRAGVGPSTADLEDAEALVLLAGRARTIGVEFIPKVLYTTPGAVALLRVVVLDRNQTRITDEVVTVQPQSGSTSPPALQDDGSWMVEYTPGEGASAGTVAFEVEAGSIASRAFLELEPRPIRALLGPSVGGVSNLGQLLSPYASLDLDYRLPWLGGQLALRAGLGAYGDEAVVDTGVEGVASVQLVVLPVSLGLLYRPELLQSWVQPVFGVGLVVAPYYGQARFDEVRAAEGLGLLPPGVFGLVGLARRWGLGELHVELRGFVLLAPGGDLAWQGQVGGLNAVVGYRFAL